MARQACVPASAVCLLQRQTTACALALRPALGGAKLEALRELPSHKPVLPSETEGASEDFHVRQKALAQSVHKTLLDESRRVLRRTGKIRTVMKDRWKIL